MHSLILVTATRFLLPLLLLFSIFLLFRGHNEPGGGFVAGLVAASAFALYSLSEDVDSARRILRIDTHNVIGAGLLIALGSGIWALFAGQPFLTEYWIKQYIPFLGEVEVGTPIIFDIGVFMVVMGVALMIIFPLAEE